MKIKKQILILVMISVIVLFLYVGISALTLTFRGESLSLFSNVTQTKDEPQDEEGITLEEVGENPEVYQGLEITIEGVIEEWIAKNAFIFAQNPLTSNTVLVLSRTNFPSPENVPQPELAIGDNVSVEVTGTLEIYDRTQIEDELQIELDDGFIMLEQEIPVLIIRTIQQIN